MPKQDFKFHLPWLQKKQGRDLINLDGSPYYFTQRFPAGIWRGAAQAVTSHRTIGGVAAIFGLAAVFTCARTAILHSVDWPLIAISTIMPSIFVGITTKRHTNQVREELREINPELANAVIDKSGCTAASDTNRSVVGNQLRDQSTQHIYMKILGNPLLRLASVLLINTELATFTYLVYGAAIVTFLQALDGKRLVDGK